MQQQQARLDQTVEDQRRMQTAYLAGANAARENVTRSSEERQKDKDPKFKFTLVYGDHTDTEDYMYRLDEQIMTLSKNAAEAAPANFRVAHVAGQFKDTLGG
eukprot:GFYU01005316.1.p1 GENE.GFYU01005316.1~~GFYU01005316.1.p1  ORF type:complete len:102 (-),score=19.30 GFYU01005316.1:83-388(-)